jgi:hypothetical protein
LDACDADDLGVAVAFQAATETIGQLPQFHGV